MKQGLNGLLRAKSWLYTEPPLTWDYDFVLCLSQALLNQDSMQIVNRKKTQLGNKDYKKLDANVDPFLTGRLQKSIWKGLNRN